MRVNLVNIVVGDRGTGKTTYMKGDTSLKIDGVLDRYLEKNPQQRILVVDTFDNPVWREYPLITPGEINTFVGPRRIFSSHTETLLSIISANCFNCVLVFEDATKFISSRLGKDTKQFILDSKQKNLDIFFIFHYLMAVPNDLSRISDWMIIFKTNEIFSSQIRLKFPNPAIEQTFNQVKAHKNRFHFQQVKISG